MAEVFREIFEAPGALTDFDSHTAGATIVAGEGYGGSNAAQFVASAAAQRAVKNVTGQAHSVFMRFRIPALPTGGVLVVLEIPTDTGNTMQIGVSTTGEFEARFSGTAIYTKSSPLVTIVPDTWYRVFAAFDTTTATHRFSWAINTSVQADITQTAAGGAATHLSVRIGSGQTSATATVFIDDLLVTDSFADFNTVPLRGGSEGIDSVEAGSVAIGPTGATKSSSDFPGSNPVDIGVATPSSPPPPPPPPVGVDATIAGFSRTAYTAEGTDGAVRAYSPRDDRMFGGLVVAEGVLPAVGDSAAQALRVSATSPTSMAVTITPGFAIIQGDDIENEGIYEDYNPADYVLPNTLGAPPSGNRIDMVVARVNSSDATTRTPKDQIFFAWVNGTPSASANLTNKLNVGQIPPSAILLAYVQVRQGAGVIQASDIEDARRVAGPMIHGEDGNRYRLGVTAAGVLGVEVLP